MNTRIPEILQEHQLRQHNGDRLWYEDLDGTCKIQEPTLLNMGEDRPYYLMFPTHYREFDAILPEAKQMANELDAFLVLLIHGEISDSEIISLILELVDTRVVPLWIGEKNRIKFDRMVAVLSRKI
jgi:hypothetical protein